MSQASQPASGWLGVSEPPPNAEVVRSAVAKVTSSSIFADSQRMERFLRFAVEETLRGNGGRLKEIVIGAEVFDRGASYDPRLDPIVRVEARRLRSKLRAYYEGEGKDDDLIIEFPKGTYQPVFKPRSPAATAPPVLQASAAIVILPFANLDPEPDQQYFSDGLTEELIHALTRIPALRVIAWNTATHFRAEQDMASIGTQLGVSYVLRGAVRRTGQRLRITAQLIDARTSQYLWSETYNREILDVFAIQEQIALVIVNALKLRLGDTGPAALGGQPQRSIECYNLCLKGRYHANERTAEGLRRAAICFEQAVAVDASSAVAYAGLADSYTLLADYGFIAPVEAVEKARASAEKALELDKNSAEAHTSLAWIRSHFEWRWPEAGELYRRAIELNPGYATAHHWLAADYLSLLGRFDDAMTEIEIACGLDPLSMIIHEGRGYILTMCGRYDEAIAEYRRMREMDPSFYKSYTSLGRVYIQQGEYRKAIDTLSKGREIAGDLPNIISALGQAFALAGDREQARKLLVELQNLAQTRLVQSNSLALLHIALGNHGVALDYLEKGADRRELPICVINVHPAYDAIRSEPRFQALLARIGFTGSNRPDLIPPPILR
jgi:TolB-like protein/Tfp pilus assembly protein PilF